MAETTGLVQQLKWNPPYVFAWVGPNPAMTELLFIQLRPGDTASVQGSKRTLARLLESAQLGGYLVTAVHPDTGAEISQVRIDQLQISAVGQPIHNDFFSVSGSGFTPGSTLRFEQGGGSITVVPDLVRPHLLFVGRLPQAIPVGRNLLSVQSGAVSTSKVPVDVSDGPLTTVRVLYSGSPKSDPYTIVFVANAAIESAAGGTFTADPGLQDRTTYHAGVVYCMQNLFAQVEDMLQLQSLDARFRIVSIFDNTLTANTASALVQQISPNLMQTRRSALAPFVSGYSEHADIVIALHGDPTFTRATAWFTSDDPNRTSTSFTYDGNARVHGHYNTIPGSAAIPASVSTGLTPLHEFGHACSDFVNGMVVDLYVDGGPGGFQVNKKFRNLATDAIPNNFASYNATNYVSDAARDTLGYPATWLSYHPALIDATRPDVMDNYWLTANPLLCRENGLMYAWVRDRLTAKAFR